MLRATSMLILLVYTLYAVVCCQESNSIILCFLFFIALAICITIERHILPFVLVLLPKHTAIGTITRNTGRHAFIPAGMSEAARPQIAIGRIPAETGAADNQISIVAQRLAEVSH